MSPATPRLRIIERFIILLSCYPVILLSCICRTWSGEHAPSLGDGCAPRHLCGEAALPTLQHNAFSSHLNGPRSPFNWSPMTIQLVPNAHSTGLVLLRHIPQSLTLRLKITNVWPCLVFIPFPFFNILQSYLKRAKQLKVKVLCCEGLFIVQHLLFCNQEEDAIRFFFCIF